MNKRKVLNVRSHVGGLHGKTSYDSEKDKADMELSPVGVLIKTLNGKPMVNRGKSFELIIPYPNCTEVIVEAVEESVKEEEPKRGPGRPPGSKSV